MQANYIIQMMNSNKMNQMQLYNRVHFNKKSGKLSLPAFFISKIS